MAEPKDLANAPLIVYVDDERPNRIVFEQNLKSEFRIKSVPDAKTALEVLENEDVAVLVSDIRMPGMDGLALLRIVKDKYPRTIRMVITAFSDVDPILAAINEGLVARYIIKPFDPDEVAQALRWATELWTFAKDSAELLRRILQTERLATLGGFAALYVHDLKNPLMVVMTLVEELRTLAKSIPVLHDAIEKAPLDERVKSQLLKKIDDTPAIVDDVSESAALIAGIMDILSGFIRMRRPATERPLIDPVTVIKRILRMFQYVTVHQRVQFGYHGPEQLPKVRMSPVDLSQVLLNIVGNAAQAVSTRSEANRKVDVDARPYGDMVEVQIRDEGVGMTPEVLQRIGTPYFTTRAEGTGLGIANCQRLVGSAGGRLKIESQHGVGTTVTLLLPISA